MDIDTLAQATPFCYHEWVTVYEGITLVHRCYLDLGHPGDHTCGDCSEMPLEMHEVRP